jgi:hypothetical protein
MHISAEDETTAGAESVIKLVEDDRMYEWSSNRGEKGNGLEELTPQKLYWLQVEEDEGPGAWEREMELVDEMMGGKLKTPYSADGAFLVDGEEYDDHDEEEEWVGVPAGSGARGVDAHGHRVRTVGRRAGGGAAARGDAA